MIKVVFKKNISTVSFNLLKILKITESHISNCFFYNFTDIEMSKNKNKPIKLPITPID